MNFSILFDTPNLWMLQASFVGENFFKKYISLKVAMQHFLDISKIQ